MRKLIHLFVFCGVLSFALPAFSQAIEIHVRPPRLKIEKRTEAPTPNMVWHRGYYTYDARSNGYTWQPGTWVAPPRPHAAWIAPTYVRRHGYWAYKEGHWR